MENFQQYLENNWPRERRSQIAASATEDQVRAVLRKDYLQPADFLTEQIGSFTSYEKAGADGPARP